MHLSKEENRTLKANIAMKILILLSIVLQSFFAVSSNLDLHQLDVEHLQIVHNHEANHSDLNVQEHDLDDCHHCGHCSGNHSSWIFVKTFTKIPFLTHSNTFFNIEILPLGIPKRLYRPPIA